MQTKHASRSRAALVLGLVGLSSPAHADVNDTTTAPMMLYPVCQFPHKAVTHYDGGNNTLVNADTANQFASKQRFRFAIRNCGLQACGTGDNGTFVFPEFFVSIPTSTEAVALQPVSAVHGSVVRVNTYAPGSTAPAIATFKSMWLGNGVWKFQSKGTNLCLSASPQCPTTPSLLLIRTCDANDTLQQFRLFHTQTLHYCSGAPDGRPDSGC